MNKCLHISTTKKTQKFFFTQIFREINFGDFRVSTKRNVPQRHLEPSERNVNKTAVRVMNDLDVHVRGK